MKIPLRKNGKELQKNLAVWYIFSTFVEHPRSKATAFGGVRLSPHFLLSEFLNLSKHPGNWQAPTLRPHWVLQVILHSIY